MAGDSSMMGQRRPIAEVSARRFAPTLRNFLEGAYVPVVGDALLHTTILVVGAVLVTVPAFSAPSSLQEKQVVREDNQPRGDRWEDRWQGRQHILYDELRQDGTDGKRRMPQFCDAL
jgi:hypothetical protein